MESPPDGTRHRDEGERERLNVRERSRCGSSAAVESPSTMRPGSDGTADPDFWPPSVQLAAGEAIHRSVPTDRRRVLASHGPGVGTGSTSYSPRTVIGMDIPPLSVWERQGALATYAGLIRDLSHIDQTEVWRRIDRLSPNQRAMVFRWICRAAMPDLHDGPSK